MMISTVFAPLLGGVIGYITNDIAIKMLFRPRKAVYIGKFKVPFTPGLIPQQKDRIAQSIGNVVSAQLLNAETLRSALLSGESMDTLRRKLTESIHAFGTREDTVEALAGHYVGQERFDGAVEALEESLAELIIQKIADSDIGACLVEYCSARLKEKFRGASLIMGQIEGSLASAVNDMVGKVAPDIVRTELRQISGDIRGKRICDLYEKYQDRIPQFVEQVLALYEKALGDNIEKILRAVDIGGIVSGKIASFDEEELENLIFGIMKRELRAIVYLGALLGFLMGFLNLLL